VISTGTSPVVRFQESEESPSSPSDEADRPDPQARRRWLLLIRHGGKHDWYRNAKTGVSQPVPRHREVKEFLAKHFYENLTLVVSEHGPISCPFSV
jgi:hypothetical protein